MVVDALLDAHADGIETRLVALAVQIESSHCPDARTAQRKYGRKPAALSLAKSDVVSCLLTKIGERKKLNEIKGAMNVPKTFTKLPETLQVIASKL
jgi:hypothetical protein